MSDLYSYQPRLDRRANILCCKWARSDLSSVNHRVCVHALLLCTPKCWSLNDPVRKCHMLAQLWPFYCHEQTTGPYSRVTDSDNCAVRCRSSNGLEKIVRLFPEVMDILDCLKQQVRRNQARMYSYDVVHHPMVTVTDFDGQSLREKCGTMPLG